jgi:hypothetical protein
MPRPNLRRVQGLVRDFCTETDLGYSEENFVESFRQIIQHLRWCEPGSASAVSSVGGIAASDSEPMPSSPHPALTVPPPPGD